MGDAQERFWKTLRELSLPGRLNLAVVSAVSTWPAGEFANQLDEVLHLPIPAWMGWQSVLHGLVFAVLVMIPFLAADALRVLRAAGMCVASIFIYDSAVGFVIDGPFGDNSVMAYVLAGGTAALLLGLAVSVLAPRRFQWRRLAGLTAAAGALGGVAFWFLVS